MSRIRLALRLALLPALVLVALTLAWRLGYFDLARREPLVALVRQVRHTSVAGLVYVIAYAVIAALGVPITVLSIIGGALFGTARGAVLAWSGAMAATLMAHTLARSIGQKSVRRLFGRHHLLDRLRKRSDFWLLLRLRLVPVGPFAMLDYVAGLLGVSLRVLLLATALGVLPMVAAYAYAGAQLITGLQQAGEARYRALWIAAGVTLITICISLVPTAFRQLRG
ncbi:MAG TPA: VTT domain-containing protein [Gemmatimonadaceae bacterium]